MAANHAREVTYEVELGVTADGRIVGMRAVVRADIGAYVRTAALVPAEFGAALLPGPYRVPNYACDLWSVVTNKTPAGTLRSPGRPECNFARERLLDQAAARLGLDRGRDPPPQPDRRQTRCRTIAAPSRSASPPSTTRVISPRSSTSCSAAWTTTPRAPSKRTLNARRGRDSPRHRSGGLRREDRARSLRDHAGRGARRRHPGGRHRCVLDGAGAGDGAGADPRRGAGTAGRALRRPPRRHRRRRERRGHLRLARNGHRGQRGPARGRQADRRGASSAPPRAGAWPTPTVTYARGTLQANGHRVTLAELAAERRLAAGASFEVPKVTYAGCACAVVLDVDPETGVITLQRVVVGADVGRAVNPALVRGPARGRRRLRDRQHAAREPDVRRRRPAAVRHADGLRAAAGHRHSRRRRLLPGESGPRPIRSACAAWASAAIPAWARPSPTRCATRWRRVRWR